jgi:phage portal protein BeeE
LNYPASLPESSLTLALRASERWSQHALTMARAPAGPASLTPYGPGGIQSNIAGALGAQAGVQLNTHGEQYRHFTGWVHSCFLAGTLIGTPEGVCPIEEFSQGDAVCDAAGRPAVVAEVMCRPYCGELVTLRGVGLPVLTATWDHPVLVDAGGQRGWRKASEVKVGDCLLVPVPPAGEDVQSVAVRVSNPNCHPNDPKFEYGRDVTVDEDLMRLTGLYLAEGYLHRQRSGSGRKFAKSVLFAFAGHEQDYLDFVDAAMQRHFGCKAAARVEQHGGSCTVLRFSSRLAAEFFAGFGSGAAGKFLPAWVTGLPPDKLRPLLRGYWEGDGCYSQRSLIMTTASADLAEGVRRAWLRCGAYCLTRVLAAGRQWFPAQGWAARNTHYQLTLCGAHFETAASVVGVNPPGTASDKAGRSMVTIADGYAVVPVREVGRRIAESPAPVYNLEVAGEHTYTAGGVAVHNCVKVISQRIAGQPVRVALLKGGAAAARRPDVRLVPKRFKQYTDRMELLENHPLLDALAFPNELMPYWALAYNTVASLELTGKSFWWFDFSENRDLPSIWPLPSSWVTPRFRDGKLYSDWEVRPGQTAQAVTVPGNLIAYFYYPDPGNPLGAVGTLQAMARSVLAHEAMSEAQRRSMSNGVFPGLAFVVGRMPDERGQTTSSSPRYEFSEEKKNQLRALIKQMYRGVLNYDEPIILDRMIEDVKKISNTQKEMDWLNSKGVTKEEICQGFGVNPIIMGHIEGANRASSAAASDHLNEYTVNPKIELISQIMTMRVAPLFSRNGQRLAAYVEPAFATDPDFELARDGALVGHAAMTINEWRARNHLPPLTGGDVVLLPVAFSPYSLENGEVVGGVPAAAPAASFAPSANQFRFRYSARDYRSQPA